MRRSILWLIWMVLPVFVLAYHFGPGQLWLARDRAAELILEAQAQAIEADKAQEVAYQAQLQLLKARRDAFLANVDWQTQTNHALAQAVITANERQSSAYQVAAEEWNSAAELFNQATETLIEALENTSGKSSSLANSDRQLLESLRWAEARAMVRGGLVFNGIDQLQALLDLRLAEAQQDRDGSVRYASTAGDTIEGKSPETQSDSRLNAMLPTEAIREELAAALYIGARLLREEGRPPEVWRPVANQARQQYRFLADHDDAVIRSAVPPESESVASPPAETTRAELTENLTRNEQVQRNLEQVLNLEQSSSDQLEGIPLPRRAPLARRPGDGEPGDRPGKRPGRGPLQDGPPGQGAGIPGPYGAGW